LVIVITPVVFDESVTVIGAPLFLVYWTLYGVAGVSPDSLIVPSDDVQLVGSVEVPAITGTAFILTTIDARPLSQAGVVVLIWLT
jgi:hypothetical protein